MTPEHLIVFISYSHDSPAHAERVLSLANRLVLEGAVPGEALSALPEELRERVLQGLPAD